MTKAIDHINMTKAIDQLNMTKAIDHIIMTKAIDHIIMTKANLENFIESKLVQCLCLCIHHLLRLSDS